jgi:hypothetical protein
VEKGNEQHRLAARRWLRVLDACLETLEDCGERGETSLPAPVAARLSAYVPGLRPGMSIPAALDRVFERQQAVMLGDPAATAVSAIEARELTEQIKHGIGQISLLLLEAHERRAWTALGYPTWQVYVDREFNLSRTRSYELVYHGQVLREIQSATGMFGIPNVSPYAALQIRANLDQVIGGLRRGMTEATTEAEAAAMVAQVVSDHRSTARIAGRGASQGGDGDRRLSPVDARRLFEALGYLAALPPATEVIRQIEVEDERTVRLVSAAADWLVQFAEIWNERGLPARPLASSVAS